MTMAYGPYFCYPLLQEFTCIYALRLQKRYHQGESALIKLSSRQRDEFCPPGGHPLLKRKLAAD